MSYYSLTILLALTAQYCCLGAPEAGSYLANAPRHVPRIGRRNGPDQLGPLHSLSRGLYYALPRHYPRMGKRNSEENKFAQLEDDETVDEILPKMLTSLLSEDQIAYPNLRQELYPLQGLGERPFQSVANFPSWYPTRGESSLNYVNEEATTKTLDSGQEKVGAGGAKCDNSALQKVLRGLVDAIFRVLAQEHPYSRDDGPSRFFSGQRRR